MVTKPDVFGIADILVAHAQHAHPGEIGIIAYYGSYAKGTTSPTSDLDILYIPDEGKARSLCIQFICDSSSCMPDTVVLRVSLGPEAVAEYGVRE
jgi:predicted nucleotidyltransferase